MKSQSKLDINFKIDSRLAEFEFWIFKFKKSN